MSDWLPISSAPKDGTTILAYFPKQTGFWARKDIAPVFWNKQFGHEDWGDVDTWFMVKTQPSHWMPLPPPPQP